ncbi:MAG: HD domain-containing protein [Sulfuricurvum sp.]|nr:HD domain-containing protein [Sulfuricurvum sp.]
MNKITECTYLNDIKGCEVTATYECGYFLEIEYLKDAVQKSLVIEFQSYGGSMGYGTKFSFSGVDLPQTLIYKERASTKLPLEMGIQRIVEINRYKKNADEEQLEIVYLDEEGLIQTYLLEYEDWNLARFPKNKPLTYEKIECDDTVMPSELFSTAVYKNALAFALKAHGAQLTPDGLPYSFHITSVALEVINSLSQHRIAYDEANVAIACALLHDVLEDTKTTMGTASIDIPDIISVLHGVNALTKNTSLPSKQEQMQDSLKRLQEQPKCVQMVKLADRITNLAPAPDYWNEEKRKNYVKEAQEILDALRGCNPYLEAKLQYRIDHYDIVKNDPFLAFYGRRGEEKIQLILDKSHPKYLKTFKAIKKLNEYVYETYELNLFRQRFEHDTYCNIPTAEGLQEHTKVGIQYISHVLNTKDLLNLNTSIDPKIEEYIRTIYEGEGCIVQ